MYFRDLYVISVLCFLPFIRCQKELHIDSPFTYHVDVAGINVTIRMMNSTLLGVENERITDFRWSVSGNNTFIDYENHNPRLTHIASYTAIGYIREPSCSGSDRVMKINETGISTIVFLHIDSPFTYHVDVAGINVTIRMMNSTLLGVENERITDFRWSVSGNNTFIDYENHNPRLTHIASYTAIGYIREPSCSGSDRVMKINETGISTIVFLNQIFRHYVNLTRIERNGVEVWKVLNTEMLGNYQTGHFDFQNLQGGSDRRRADILLRINNLYPQIIENIRSQIDDQLTTILFDRNTRSILDGAPADELMICPNPHHGNISRRLSSGTEN
ncbi:unnamed protein product [Phaedon cochleariae]|uniref:Uncharacterized protein n=1 Tax=Phaedon cochleariae TaxID=80249 RepID=A0A9N9SEW6_PHACE|nr:unnamed protein product [Phaedon cochleariae]